MANRDDRSYYSLRAEEEIRCGDTASAVVAAVVHYELAYRYSLKAAESIANVPELTLIQGSRVAAFVPTFPAAAPGLVAVPSEASG